MDNVKKVAMAYTSEKGQKEFFDAIYHGFCEDTTLQVQFFPSIEGCRSYFQYHMSNDWYKLASTIESMADDICDKWFFYTYC